MEQILMDVAAKSQYVNGIWMIPQYEVKKAIITAYNIGKLDSDKPQTNAPPDATFTINGFTYTREEFERYKKQYEE